MPAAVNPTAPVSYTSLPDTKTHTIRPSMASKGVRYAEATIRDFEFRSASGDNVPIRLDGRPAGRVSHRLFVKLRTL